MSAVTLKKTALHPVYSGRSGVKLVDFGGWEMPVQFENGILAEHRAVREHAGLFDVSHMGEISVEGLDAALFLDRLLTNIVIGVEPGRCIYTAMCREDGGTVDDLLVYVLEPDFFILVVNAANTGKDYDWIVSSLKDSGLNAVVENVSSEWAQLALQGPDAASLLKPLMNGLDPDDIRYYRHAGMIMVGDVLVLLSRTGYTGEDGFELYCGPEEAAHLWEILENAGAVPCGLGARDVLRLEARLPLYGHELGDNISPLEAGIGMFVKLEKEAFTGREALAGQKESGIPRKVYGLEMIDPGVAREGYPVYYEGKLLGEISSGSRSPVRNSFIALALLKRDSVKIGDIVNVEIRGKMKSARLVKTPFYRRG